MLVVYFENEKKNERERRKEERKSSDI